MKEQQRQFSKHLNYKAKRVHINKEWSKKKVEYLENSLKMCKLMCRWGREFIGVTTLALPSKNIILLLTMTFRLYFETIYHITTQYKYLLIYYSVKFTKNSYLLSANSSDDSSKSLEMAQNFIHWLAALEYSEKELT